MLNVVQKRFWKNFRLEFVLIYFMFFVIWSIDIIFFNSLWLCDVMVFCLRNYDGFCVYFFYDEKVI